MNEIVVADFFHVASKNRSSAKLATFRIRQTAHNRAHVRLARGSRSGGTRGSRRRTSRRRARSWEPSPCDGSAEAVFFEKPKPTMRELCPRSYDVVERAELQSLRVDLFDDETRENPVTVTVRQDPSVGIPGVVYDCAVHLAAFVVDEVFSKVSTSSDERERGPVRVLELGAGTGACGCLLTAACARRNVEIHLTLTDRKPAALALCAANLAANACVFSRKKHEKKYATRRYAFGDPIDDLLRDPIDDSRVPSGGVAHDDGDDGDDAREKKKCADDAGADDATPGRRVVRRGECGAARRDAP